MDENLNRIKDILNELTTRLEPLEKASQKARKYLDLYTQKKQTDVSIYLYDIEIIKRQLNEIEIAYNTARCEFEIADETLNSFETQSERLFDVSQETKLKIEQISGRIKEYDEHRQDIINARSILQNDILHIKTQINQAESDLEIKVSVYEEAMNKNKEIESNYLIQKNILTDFDSQSLSADDNLNLLYKQRILLEDMQEKTAKQTAVRNDELTSLKIKLSALNNSFENLPRNAEIINHMMHIQRLRTY